MVTVRVEHGDVLARETDVLVLKYAQALHGVDREAVRRIGNIPPKYFPAVGRAVGVPTSSRIGAAYLVLVGVTTVHQFGYEAIRDFGRLAIIESIDLRPREVCLTLHGVGSGFDEAEAFRAEIAGVYDALDAGEHNRALEHVTIVEHDARRAERLERLLGDLERDRAAPPRQPDDANRSGSEERVYAFAAVPFRDDFDDHFDLGIRPPLDEVGLLCERMDRIHYVGDVVATMVARIRNAELVVADITSGNPNVYLEVGYAWAADKPTILLCHEDVEPAFDLRGQHRLSYKNIGDLRKQLRAELAGLGWQLR